MMMASQSLLDSVQSYIDRHYAAQGSLPRRSLLDVESQALPGKKSHGRMPPTLSTMSVASSARQLPLAEAAETGLEALVGNLDEAFSVTLLRLIDATGKKDADIYRRANIDRRLFSKIRNNEHYTPSKPTVLAFAIALELTLDQTKDLLARAGFALSHSRKLDVIVEYFMINKKYDVFEINEVLLHYDQPLLGG